jgi:hypothetical protein
VACCLAGPWLRGRVEIIAARSLDEHDGDQIERLVCGIEQFDRAPPDPGDEVHLGGAGADMQVDDGRYVPDDAWPLFQAG